MAKLKEEDLRLNIIVNGDGGRKRILDLEKAIDDATLSVRSMKKEQEMLAKQGQTDSARYKELTKSIKDETASIKANRAELDNLRGKLSLNSMTVSELTKRLKTLKAEFNRAVPGTAEWKRLNQELKVTEARLSQVKGGANATGRAMTALTKAQAAVTGAIGVIYGVARVFGGAVNTLKDFEQANVNLATILGRAITDIGMLTSEAERLGRTTRYTASEVTGLQIELAKLGFNEGQIQTMEESVLHFATAVGTDLPEAAALAGATLRMFGLSTGDTEDVLATLALATNKSALSFSFFQSAMSTVGPVANTFGFSVKDTTALLGSLANAGFDASSAATATRNIILNLADANGKLSRALGEPVRTFDDLIAGLQSLDEKGIDLATTLELTDKRSVAAFNTFLHGTDAAAALRAELEETGGVLKQIAEQRANTLAGTIDKLSSAWEGFILKLKGSTGFLKQAVEYLTQIVTWITPGSRHDADVENTVGTLTAGYGTAEGRAFVAGQKVDDLKKQLDGLDEALENVNDRRSRRRIEKEKKRIEKELSVYQDAYSRLRSAADALADDSTTAAGGSGNSFSGGKQSEKERKAAARKAEQERKKQEQELKKAAAEAKKQREEVAKLEDRILQARIAAADSYNDKANAQVEAENARFKKEMDRLEGKKGQIKDYDQAVETLQRQHSNNLRKIELDRISAEAKDMESVHKYNLAQIQQNSEYELQLETTSSARKLQIQKDRDKKITQENLRFAQEQYRFLQDLVSSGEIAGIALSKEHLDQYKLQLEEVRKQLQDADAALKNQTSSSVFSGTGDASLFGVNQADWETFFSNLADGTLKAKDLQTAISGIGGAAQEGFNLANQAVQLANAKEKKALDDYKKGQESRKKSLEDRYKAGLMTESQYNAEVEKMEADLQAKQEETERKQAQRTKTMSIVESIINTALAATKALAQGGMPAGPIMAGIITAMGAAQTALIAAQPVGFAEGGYVVRRKQDGKRYEAVYDPDKRGYVDRPTILVGENGGEYVIPADALKNPDIRAYANVIEQARKSGRLRSLRMEAISPVSAISGRAMGGFTPGATPSESSAAMADLTRLADTVDRLSAVLENGIDANVSMLGRGGLVNMIEKYERAKSRGNLYDRNTYQIRSNTRSGSGR